MFARSALSISGIRSATYGQTEDWRIDGRVHNFERNANRLLELQSVLFPHLHPLKVCRRASPPSVKHHLALLSSLHCTSHERGSAAATFLLQATLARFPEPPFSRSPGPFVLCAQMAIPASAALDTSRVGATDVDMSPAPVTKTESPPELVKPEHMAQPFFETLSSVFREVQPSGCPKS